MSGLDADALIARLMLAPHPEGGYYRETFRDTATGPAGRSASSAILFLLKAGQRSRWHRVLDAAEVWHWHAGAPLELGVAPPVGNANIIRLGPDIAAGEMPQAVVPAGFWQQAQSKGDFTLVGCTVAPAFLFECFEMAPPDFEPGS